MLIYAAIVLGTIIATFRQPAAAVGLLLCTYGLEQWAQSQSSYFWMHGTLTNYATALVAAFGICVHIARGRPVFGTLTREYALIVGIYLWARASAMWSIYPTGTVEQFNAELPYIIPFALWLPLLVGDRRELRTALLSTLTIGSILAALILTTSQWQGRSIKFQSGLAIAGEGIKDGNPLAIGTLGAYIAIIAMLMNFRGLAQFWKIFRYVIIGLGFALAIKSGSRGQSIGMVVGCLCFLPYSRRFKDLPSTISFLIGMALFAAITFVLFDQLTRTSTAERNARWEMNELISTYSETRVGMAGIVLRAYLDAGPLYWVLGLGSSASFDPRLVGFYPHMVPAEALAELGFVGITWFCLLMYYAFRNVFTSWRFVRDDPEDRGMFAIFGAILIFETVLLFKEGSVLGSSTFYGLTAILGRVAWSLRQEAAHYAQLDAGGYVMTADELALEAQTWGDDFGDADDIYSPVPAGRA